MGQRTLATCRSVRELLTEQGVECVIDDEWFKDREAKNAVEEFVEKLKKKVHNYYPSIDSYCTSRHVILVKDIDELLKEYEQ